MDDRASTAQWPRFASADREPADALGRSMEVAFIDPGVSDADMLLAGLRPGIDGIVLNTVDPAPQQMARALAGRQGLKAVHVIAHGAPGIVNFAAGQLSSEALDVSAADLAAVGSSLEQDGELLLWS